MTPTQSNAGSNSAGPSPGPAFPRIGGLDLPRGTTPSILWSALGLLSAGLIITVLTALYLRESVSRDAQRDFDFTCNEIQLNINARLTACAHILRSGKALFDASGTVDRDKWRAYVQGLEVDRQLPGIQGVGFSELVRPEQLPQHLERIRAQGFPEYAIKPPGEREVYSSIIFLEPFLGRNLRAFGYDMYSEPVRRAAMERARDENSAALSGRVVLVQETNEDVQAGTLMYVPVYRPGLPLDTVENRRSALLGWVYSPYRMTDLMHGILRGWEVKHRDRRLFLQVYDGESISTDALLYDSQTPDFAADASQTRFTRQNPTDFGGRRWTLQFTQLSVVRFSDYGSVWLVLISGTLINLLLFGFILSLMSTRVNARRLAEQLMVELREGEESYRNQFANNSAVMLLVDPIDGAIIDANATAAEFYGYSRDQLLTMRIGDINTLPTNEVQETMGRVTTTHGSRFGFQHRLADGSLRDVEVASSRVQFGGREILHSIIQDVTERKRAEAELHEERLRLAGIIEGTNVGTWEWKVQTGETVFNEHWAEIIGYTLDEISPVSIDTRNRFTHPDDLERSADGLRRHFTKELDYYECELRMRHKEGHWIWVLDRGKVAVWTDEDLPLLMLGTHQDITDRKSAEEELRQSADRLKLATRAGGVGIWDYDVILNQLVWDEEMFRLYGITPDTFEGAYEAWAAGLHLEDRQRGDEEIQLALRGEKDFNTEFRVVWPDGTIRNIRALAVVQRDASGRPLSMVGTNWDITALKGAEEALRKSEGQLRLLLDSTGEAIYGIDLEGNCTFCNPSCLRMLGYDCHEDLLGKNMHWLIHHTRPNGQHFPVEACGIFRACSDGTPCHVDDEVLWRADGTCFPVEYWSYVQRRGGTIIGAVVTFIDITLRKRADEELREANRRLEQTTQEAKDLAQRAETANVAKSEFLANMSHEIRTPMNGVIGMSHLLLDTELNPKQRTYATTLLNSGESLLALLNDILDFSKIEAGKLDLETLDFHLHSLLDDFASILALRVHEKGIEFVCGTASDVPAHLCGDPGRLRQILVNLAGNALKFTTHGEIVVFVTLLEDITDDVLLRFSVKDTGIGIPADKQRILFQKFTQADASTTRQYGGTGLGLAISKQLVEIMGGEIGVESEEGHGSEFWFTVRMKKGSQTPLVESILPDEIHGAHILIVDDNATNRELLSAQLAYWSVRAETVNDAPAALLALCRALDAGDPFRAAILDMHMRGMDGESLARVIKADKKLRDVQLVLMTSLGQPGETRKMEEAGFSAYLTKPVRQFDIYACLSALLSDTSTSLPQPIITRHTVREKIRPRGHVLLVEDNLTNQQVALGILEKLGVTADATANGIEALQALEKNVYDLVLMDVQMAKMDGYEATRQIRNPKSAVLNHAIPVVAMTAHAMQGDRLKCIEAGMNDYITKPIIPDVLASTLRKWLLANSENNQDSLSNQPRPTA